MNNTKMYQRYSHKGCCMDLTSFFTKEFVIDGIVVKDTSVSVNLISVQKSSSCPECRVTSEGIHSKYNRTLLDLIILCKAVIIKLLSKKFFYDNSYCS